MNSITKLYLGLPVAGLIMLNVLLVAQGKPPIDISSPIRPLVAVIIVLVIVNGVTIRVGAN